MAEWSQDELVMCLLLLAPVYQHEVDYMSAECASGGTSILVIYQMQYLPTPYSASRYDAESRLH